MKMQEKKEIQKKEKNSQLKLASFPFKKYV